MATSALQIDQKKFTETQSALQKMVSTILVKDAETCLQAKTAQRDIRSEMKLRHAVLDPFVIGAKRNLESARDEVAKWIGPLEDLDDALATKVKQYEREEREAAQREQDKINTENARLAKEKADAEAKAAKEKAELDKKARIAQINAMEKRGEIGKREKARLLREAGAFAEAQKEQADAEAEAAKNAPPPAVTVKPNIPAVAGVPSRRNYRAEVTDDDRFIAECAKRLVNGDTSLLEFVMVNGSAVAAKAREMKDSKAFMAKYPFTKATDD